MLRSLRRNRKNPVSDQELLARFRQTGDQAFLGQLYERYLELTYGLCLKYLGEETLAQDAVIEIYESLVRKLPEHDVQYFRSWLYTFAKNHCLMQLRKDGKKILQTFDPGLMQSVDFRHLNNEDDLPDGEQAHWLQDCLKGLSDQQKRCIELFYYQDKSYKEIAELDKQDLGTVRSHIQNGRRNLRKCMDQKQADELE
ncbi:MAG: sigma-70 family RNA polymerase sigma factor [Lewinellaceae bacterium]|nr:sigma-70 family RNA polymerase sigma factor [Lewinella sp.]MCB9281698.1 sigma-70 family RNA polymerase sigma factor [Lewinellaceae bacterium]